MNGGSISRGSIGSLRENWVGNEEPTPESGEGAATVLMATSSQSQKERRKPGVQADSKRAAEASRPQREAKVPGQTLRRVQGGTGADNWVSPQAGTVGEAAAMLFKDRKRKTVNLEFCFQHHTSFKGTGERGQMKKPRGNSVPTHTL